MGNLIASVVLLSSRQFAEGQAAADLHQQATACARQFNQQLDDWTGRLETPAARRVLDHFRLHRDPSRIYLCVPAERFGPGADAELVDRSVLPSELRDALETQGRALTSLAEQAVQAGQLALAYRLAHEALFFAPDQPSVRQALGLGASRSQGGYELRVQRMSRREPRLGWPANRYVRLMTPHYVILSNDEEATVRQLAIVLEQLHAAWEQLFFDCWHPRTHGRVVRTLQFARNPMTKRHQIVLFRTPDDYVQAIRRVEPRAELTRGYYHIASRTAYFVGGASPQVSTWKHEATHQLFSELPDSSPQVGTRGHVWLVEGVAMYMESLQAMRGLLTVGGLEASRLQYARFRALRAKADLPLAELVQFDSMTLQRHTDIRGLYSQCAGLTHCLMHAESGRFRPALFDYLARVYHDRAHEGTLPDVTHATLEELERVYLEYLRVNDQDLQQLDRDAHIVDLAVGGQHVTDAGLQSVPNWAHLEWLDLFDTRVTDAGLEGLAQASRLRQLSLEQTAVTDATVQRLAAAHALEQLDLSHTRLTDAALHSIGQIDTLQSLWLTGTPITDAGLMELQALSQLTTLDLHDTRTTPDGRAKLQRALPQCHLVE